MKKTVRDAVSHFDGEWPALSYDKNWIVYRNSDGFENWSTWNDSELNTTWQRVCTRDQFDKFADGNEYGFDLAVKEFYDDGKKSPEYTRNPYDRETQRVAFYAFSAGYCDKHGKLPGDG